MKDIQQTLSLSVNQFKHLASLYNTLEGTFVHNSLYLYLYIQTRYLSQNDCYQKAAQTVKILLLYPEIS